MASESDRQRKARENREDRDRCLEAARRFRRSIRAGEYDRLPHPQSMDLLKMATVLDSAAHHLPELPRQLRSDILAVVAGLLDDAAHKPGPVRPLSDGPGH